MIKTWFKHKLAEISLNAMFNNIANNFQQLPKDGFRTGDHYQWINYSYFSPDGSIIEIKFNNCLIEFAHPENDAIYIKYQYLSDYKKIHSNGSVTDLSPRTGHGYGSIEQTHDVKLYLEHIVSYD